MRGHSRSKNGVTSFAYGPRIHAAQSDTQVGGYALGRSAA
jgi:hypothetical protein